VACGSVSLNGENLDDGDGAAVRTAGLLRIEGLGAAEALLFDMAA
jgi:hypothetical protein